MTINSAPVADLWVKIIGMLQQNWASIEPGGEGVCLLSVSDTGEIFDRLPFAFAEDVEDALRRNGFRRFRESTELHGFLSPPDRPYSEGRHPNGPIYSSGRFWL